MQLELEHYCSHKLVLDRELAEYQMETFIALVMDTCVIWLRQDAQCYEKQCQVKPGLRDALKMKEGEKDKVY